MEHYCVRETEGSSEMCQCGRAWKNKDYCHCPKVLTAILESLSISHGNTLHKKISMEGRELYCNVK